MSNGGTTKKPETPSSPVQGATGTGVIEKDVEKVVVEITYSVNGKKVVERWNAAGC